MRSHVGPIIFLSCYLYPCPSELGVSLLCSIPSYTSLLYLWSQCYNYLYICPLPYYTQGLPWWPCKESACNAGDPGSIPWLADLLEKGMATHSSILAWRIPWTEEPSGLQSMASQKAGHDWVTNTYYTLLKDKEHYLFMILLHSGWWVFVGFFLQYVKSCLWDKRTKVNSDYKIERVFQEHIWENLGIT